MKKIIASLLLVSLTASMCPIQASWSNGLNQTIRSGSIFLALGGLLAAGAGISYLKENGFRNRENQISNDLATLEYESAYSGYVTPYTESLVESDEILPSPFGQERRRTASRTVHDPAMEAQRNRVNTRNTLARLGGSLTQAEYDRLSKAKFVYDQTLQNNGDIPAQANALAALQRIINELKLAHPSYAGEEALSILGIMLGAAGLFIGLVDFADGAQR